MNTKKYCRQIRIISILAVFSSFIWLFWTLGRTYAIFIDPPKVSEGNEFVPLVLASGYAIFSVVLVIFLGVFLYNQQRSLKSGTLFSKRCENALFAWTAIWPFYDICASNMDIMQRQHDMYDIFVVDGSTVGIPIIIFTFALLYKIARQVAEENQLTI